jgi:hypothetical protein
MEEPEDRLLTVVAIPALLWSLKLTVQEISRIVTTRDRTNAWRKA